MRTASDLFPLLAALKEMHRDLQALRKEIDELNDEVRVMQHTGGNVQYVINLDSAEQNDETDCSSSSSECDSVQSAPATVSYERGGEDVV